MNELFDEHIKNMNQAKIPIGEKDFEICKVIEDNLNYPFPNHLVWLAYLYFWVGQDNVNIEDFEGYRKNI